MNLREMKQMAQKAFKEKVGDKPIEYIETSNNKGVIHEKPSSINSTNTYEEDGYEEE